MGISLLHRPIYQCRLRGGEQRKGWECGAQRLSGKYEDKRRIGCEKEKVLSMWTGKNLSIDTSLQERKPLKCKRSVVRKEGWHSFIKLIQISDCSYNTNGLCTSDLLRCVLCLQQNYGIVTFKEEEWFDCVGADQKHRCVGRSLWALLSTSHYSRPFTF